MSNDPILAADWHALLLGIVIAAVSCAVVLWGFNLPKIWRREPILPIEPRHGVPWGLVDLVILAITFVVLIFTSGLIARQCGYDPPQDPAEMTADQLAVTMVLSSLSFLATFWIAILLLRYRARANAHDFGLSLRHLPGDLVLGATAFVMIAIPTYFLQGLLARLLLPPEHPIIDLIRKQSDNTMFYIAGFSAICVAPIVEEFFFRVLLQGWLENLGQAWRGWRAKNSAEQEDIPRLLWGQTYYAAEQRPLSGAGDAPPTGAPPAFPYIVSAAVFAMMHWGHGPSPVSLFVLALGLGYLYQRTHRIMPCIVVHAMLNSTTLFVLWWSVRGV